MFNEVYRSISVKTIQALHHSLEYRPTVFPPTFTIYLHQKSANVQYHFTLKGFNVCDEKALICVEYSKDGTYESRKTEVLEEVLDFGFFEWDYDGAKAHCAKVIADWLVAKGIRK